MQALAETNWQFKDSLVSSEDQNVASGIQKSPNRSRSVQDVSAPVPWSREEACHPGSRRCNPTHVCTLDHGSQLLFGLIFFSSGANRFCSIMRARCERTFTVATLIVRAVAVSATLNSSTSRSRKASFAWCRFPIQEEDAGNSRASTSCQPPEWLTLLERRHCNWLQAQPDVGRDRRLRVKPLWQKACSWSILE